MINIFKIALAIVLLLCLADMPYGYYQLVRIVSITGFGIFAYDAFQKKAVPLAIVYIGLILLFQPFEKIALGRLLWNIVDVAVALGLLASIFIEKKKEV